MTILKNFFVEFPERLIYDPEARIARFIDWAGDTFAFLWGAIRQFLLRFADITHAFLDFVPWSVFVVVLFIAGWRLTSWKMGLLLAVLTFAIGMFGYWDNMLLSLTIILAGVIISVILGLPLGIIMSKSEKLEAVMRVVLDTMQTLPAYAYLIPALMFFGFGRAAGLVAVIIFALPPLIRLTYLGITNISDEMIEAGLSFGSSPMQMLFKIELPQALKSIAAGINQTTMMAVSMIVLAAMIGAEGAGRQGVALILYRAVVGQRAAEAVVAGFVLVFMAIILDRLIQGFTERFDKGGE